MNNLYSNFCNHDRLQRIDKNFVRCLNCGQSIVCQHKISTNKSMKDFARENKNFTRNFDRNFSNILEEQSEKSTVPQYEFYTDNMMTNKIIVDRRIKFQSDPPKYEVIVNGSKYYLTNEEIQQLLSDARAVRVDESLFNNYFAPN